MTMWVTEQIETVSARRAMPPLRRVDLAIVVPTFNERDNVGDLLTLLESALDGIAWEAMFVDDDSPDGTAALLAEIARRDARVRVIHRVGRRGLSSACIEGILATTANYVAVMDADMQHDETILPRMLNMVRKDSLDIVVGSRNTEGGSMGEFGRRRVRLSRLGQSVSNAVCHCPISDPMSGFFLFNRAFFLEVVHQLHGGGFKILVDMLASSQRPVRFGEVGYTFRSRRHGKSKLDINTAVEYLLLVIDKLAGRFLPVRFVAFMLVGVMGAVVHFACLFLLLFVFHDKFRDAQIIATYIAMTSNFFLNNFFTWRDRALHGFRLLTGLMTFWIACSFGAWANVVFARTLLESSGVRWWLAGAAGLLLSSVWNYSMSNLFTWQKARPSRAPLPAEPEEPQLHVELGE